MPTIIRWALLPYLLLIIPAVAVMWLRYRRAIPTPYFSLFIIPFLTWGLTAWLVSRPSSLANLAIEPRWVAGVVNVCFVPEAAGWGKDDISKTRLLFLLIACSIFTAWIGAYFPEIPE